MVVQEDVGFNLALPLLPHSGHQMQEVIAVVAVAEDRVLVDASVHEMDGVAGGPGVGGGKHERPFVNKKHFGGARLRSRSSIGNRILRPAERGSLVLDRSSSHRD